MTPLYIRAGREYYDARTLESVARIEDDGDGEFILYWPITRRYETGEIERWQGEGFIIGDGPNAADDARELIAGLDALSVPAKPFTDPE